MKKKTMIGLLCLMIGVIAICGIVLFGNSSAAGEQGEPPECGTFTAHLPEHFVWGGNAAARSITRLADSVRDMQDVDLIINIPAYNNGPVRTISANAFGHFGATTNTQGNVINVNIPYGITSIGTSAFRGNEITSVVFAESNDNGGYNVVIGNNAFYSNQISTLTLSSNVASIGASAFRRNNLVDVVIPGSVITIGDNAFRNNGTAVSATYLTTVTLMPGNLQSIGQHAFNGDGASVGRGITGTIFIPNSVTEIGQRAFNDNMLEDIEFEENSSLLIIRDSAFRNNPPLRRVWLPDGVHTIEGHAFASLFNLEKVFIPSTVTTIYANAFLRTWSNIPTNTYATIFVERPSTNIPSGWAANAIPTGQTTGTMPIHSPNNFNFIIWDVERAPTITITHIGGRESTHEINLFDDFSPTLDPGRVQNVTINGQALTDKEGALVPNRSALWERGEFNTRSFVLDLFLIGHDLDIVILGDRIWDINFTDHYEADSLNADVYDGEGIILPGVTVQKTGHTFGGWQINGVGQIHAAGSTVNNITNDTEFVAVWNVNSYTITLDLDGGAGPGNINQNFGTKLSAPSNPTKDGHIFAGWTHNGNPFAFPETMPAESITVVATWTIRTFTITTTVAGEPTIRTVHWGYVLDRPTSPPSPPAGLTFLHWATAPNSMTEMDTSIVVTANLWVYAVFSTNVYSVQFLNYDGTLFQTISQTFGVSLVLPDENPMKEDYIFAGWAGVPSAMPSNENLQIQPVFNPIKSHTVNLVIGDETTTITVIENGYLTLTPHSPSRAGHIFIGWAAVENGAIVHAPNATITITENQILWAVFAPITNNGGFPWTIVAIAGGSLLLLGTLVFIVLRRRSKPELQGASHSN